MKSEAPDVVDACRGERARCGERLRDGDAILDSDGCLVSSLSTSANRCEMECASGEREQARSGERWSTARGEEQHSRMVASSYFTLAVLNSCASSLASSAFALVFNSHDGLTTAGTKSDSARLRSPLLLGLCLHRSAYVVPPFTGEDIWYDGAYALIWRAVGECSRSRFEQANSSKSTKRPFHSTISQLFSVNRNVPCVSQRETMLYSRLIQYLMLHFTGYVRKEIQGSGLGR